MQCWNCKDEIGQFEVTCINVDTATFHLHNYCVLDILEDLIRQDIESEAHANALASNSFDELK